MALLTATGIHKRFGQLEVLKGVDLSLDKGEIVSIVGPSGSGKSTLLHILGTLDRADSGQLTLGGNTLTKLAGRKLAEVRNRRIGFVFQFHHLLPEFTALENVSIPAWIAGRSRNSVRPEAERLLGLLGLGHRLDHKPGTLSGGEAQRVAVARALINRPDIVFADEPTGNLDSANAKELHDLFFRLRAELGQTFLIVTHNEELAQLSDRVVSMKDGKVVKSEMGSGK
ncbi:MAG: ABC transporter ATP-binding protein [Chitinophagaceae bacterium]|nr:MAG: ABC transporter ATP-binding protein [Chitinophagaceae bacterium]